METLHKPHVIVDVDVADDEEQRRASCSSSPTESGNTEIKERRSSVSEVDLECGESKVRLAKVERDCRICHLSLDATNPESGVPIELGCSCKDDLAAAHKQCAEAWFKIKGNKLKYLQQQIHHGTQITVCRTCEICGSTACNVADVNETDSVDQWNESTDTTPAALAAPIHLQTQRRNFWQRHRFLNFLLACMVFAFVISWLFHFNMPS